MIKGIQSKRYKLLIHEDKTYLLDLDTNKITWFLPFLVWFLPMKAYLLSNDEVLQHQEKNIKFKKSQLGLIVLSTSILTSSLIGILDENFWKTVYFDNKLVLLISLLFIWTVTIIARFFFRYKKNEYNPTKAPIYVKFHFSKNIVTYLTKTGLAMLFFYTILYFMSNIFINFGNILTLGIIVPIIYLLIIVNTTIFPPSDIEYIEFLNKGI